VRLDRKLLLIAPTIVLFFVVAGMLFAAFQLHLIAGARSSLKQRSDFVAAVGRGEKTLNAQQSLGLLELSVQVEEKRAAAVVASRDLVIALALIAFAACCVLGVGIRSVPREHWPRFNFGNKSGDSSSS
jgi:hypothetical protein